MSVDRTTKAILGAIALGIWTLIVLLVLAPRAGTAAGEGAAGTPAIAVGSRGVYIAQDGKVYRFVETLGRPNNIGDYGPNVRSRD